MLSFVSRSIFTRQVRPICRLAYSPCYTSRITLQARPIAQRNLTTTHAGSIARSVPLRTGLPLLCTVIGVASVGLGLSGFVGPKIYCDSPGPRYTAASPPPPPPPPPPPTSTVNLYELSFGTVCGLCAGVFLKKGAKAVAFLLGGAFVLLQYLGSTSIVRIDWAKMASRFENLFYTKDPITGQKRAPNVYSLWKWLIDFLTADFQQRASFIAGLALGLRVG